MTFSRRTFLRGAAAAGAFAAAPSACRAPRETKRSERVVVVLALHGGLDALTLCAPYTDANLYRARPTLAVPPPGSANGALDLDGRFGLAPCAAPLLAPFRAGRLTFVHGVGPGIPTRSHFDAVRIAEQGAPHVEANEPRPGWLARFLAAVPPREPGALRGIAIDRFLPASLAGATDALAVLDPHARRVFADQAEERAALRELYGTSSGAARATAQRTFRVLERLERLHVDVRQPPHGEPYPEGEFGTRLARAAAWIRADPALEVVTITLGGWDHHNALGPKGGAIAKQLDELARGLAAFDRDLGAARERVTLVAFSEFGRRVAENASAGLDHGHGGIAMLLGSGFHGGRVVADGVDLAPEKLDQGDVPVVHDTRSVLAELLAADCGPDALGRVFTGFTPRFAGLTG